MFVPLELGFIDIKYHGRRRREKNAKCRNLLHKAETPEGLWGATWDSNIRQKIEVEPEKQCTERGTSSLVIQRSRTPE